MLTDDKVQVIQGFNHVKSVVATKQLGYFRTISSDNLIHEGINIVAVDLSKLQEQGTGSRKAARWSRSVPLC